MKVIGIDLAGLERNPTGFCILTDKGSEVKTVFSDNDIIKEIENASLEPRIPDIIAIDAPFSFPKKGYYRDGDKLLKQEGFHCLSPRFPGMRPLVIRAMKLVRELRSRDFNVIEVFPRASEKILGLQKERKANPHEYDALLCALTGKYFLEGKFRSMGKEKIIIPKLL